MKRTMFIWSPGTEHAEKENKLLKQAPLKVPEAPVKSWKKTIILPLNSIPSSLCGYKSRCFQICVDRWVCTFKRCWVNSTNTIPQALHMPLTDSSLFSHWIQLTSYPQLSLVSNSVAPASQTLPGPSSHLHHHWHCLSRNALTPEKVYHLPEKVSLPTLRQSPLGYSPFCWPGNNLLNSQTWS